LGAAEAIAVEAAPEEPHPTAAVRKVLDTLAWEIELAGARCAMLDSVIGGVIARTPSAERDQLMQSLHAVDLLNQHLHGLAAFSRNLSLQASARARIPVQAALSDLTLGSLAERLATSLGGVERDLPDIDSGDLDLF